MTRHLGRALSILGVDLLAPTDGERSESPAKLAENIFKAMGKHMLMGVLVAIAGLATIFTAIRMKNIRTNRFCRLPKSL